MKGEHLSQQILTRNFPEPFHYDLSPSIIETTWQAGSDCLSPCNTNFALKKQLASKGKMMENLTENGPTQSAARVGSVENCAVFAPENVCACVLD